MAALGHTVIAVEPSDRMRGIARAVHPDAPIEWIDASLPKVDSARLSGRRFDVILLSAVWMHLHPSQRYAALERLSQLLAPGGRIYLTLRLGKPDRDRVIYSVTADELAALAPQTGLIYRALDEEPDLLGRADVRWQSVVLTRPTPKAAPSAPLH